MRKHSCFFFRKIRMFFSTVEKEIKILQEFKKAIDNKPGYEI